jgi:glycosyltransferase involved in cell wall biosynthesis
MAEVTVAIPSFRRPKGLERLLRAIEQLETEADVSVLVADNDAEGREAFKLCESLRATYRWPLTCIVAEHRGISQARNALVEYVLAIGTADFVAMLDDDEWPDPCWLDSFLRMQTETNADALHGAVLREFESAPGGWAVECHGIAAMREKSGTIPMIDSTSNVLVRRSCFEDLPKPCFDPAFALTGGEDRDFFERLRRLGKRFAWADEAIAYAWVPASRATFGWVLQRAYRTGNSDMRVFLKHPKSRREYVREVMKIAGAAVVYPGLAVVQAPITRRSANALCKLCRAAGKLTAIFGHAYNEYAIVHGD